MKTTIPKEIKESLSALIRKYIRIRRRQAALDAEIKQVRDEIIAIVKKFGTDGALVCGNHKAVVAEQKQINISYKALAEKHPKIAKKFATETNYTRLNIH